MITFWLLAGGMALVALLFVIPPLLRGARGSAFDRDALNTAVIREQLAELEADLAMGRLDADTYQAARRDLERGLLDDLDAGSDSNTATHGGRWAAAAVALLVPLLAVVIYQQLGAGHLLERLQGNPPAAADNGAAAAHPMEAMVAQLAERMRSQPDELEGWLLLGRSYATLNRFREAADAYAQARRLAGDQPELLTDYADMLVMASDGEFTDEVGELLKTALEKKPDDIKALWLMGHWYQRHGNPSAAVEHWQRAAARLPPDSEDYAVISRQIRQAGGQPQQRAESAAAPPAAKQAAQRGGAAAGIRVSVELDPAFRNSVSPDDTVFIFARAVNGPRMPLAIVRKRVADLPVTVTLDDSMAMSPAMALSEFSEISVGARISKSGQATAAPGDIEGMVSPVQTTGGPSVTLVIDRQVP